MRLRHVPLSGLILVTALAACGTDPIPSHGSAPIRPGADAPPDPAGAATLGLSVGVPFASLQLPPHSRPHAPTPPDKIALAGWRRGKDGAWVTSLPIRTRNFYYFKPSPGMAVLRADGTEVPHKYYSGRKGLQWSYDDKDLRIHGWEGDAPAGGELSLSYARATAREGALNLAASGEKPEDFARTSVQIGRQSRSGLLLPAPATASWNLTVPPAAELRFGASLVAPEIADGPASDGATLRFEVTSAGQTKVLWSESVSEPSNTPVRVDLSAYAGQQITLTASSEPGADNRFDYVFLADPVVSTKRNHPRRVVMVFVDTLRPDHMSTFGYERETMPALDAVADAGVRFSQARNVAPWTLPSSRSVLTGNDPELYFVSDTLQGRLREAGFASAMFAGNLYLSANFGLHRDWSLHDADLLPPASDQVDKALAWLDEEAGRDQLLLIHLMEPHLPYREPKEYRTRFAGERPAKFPSDVFHLHDIRRIRPRTKAERDYVRDRYDNNIRYADDQLARLYGRLGPDDIVVFFSDHGEEFWDHGGFEHGHSLWDELLHVPLVIKAPGIDPSSIDTPVSLLDVTPTVLDLLGLEVGDLKGSSLVDLMKGDEAARSMLASRPQAFGRPLYGKERWGVLHEGTKYATIEGKELAFNLGDDPAERKDLLEDQPELAAELRGQLAEAMGTDVVAAWSLAPRPSNRSPEAPLTATVTVPGGFRSVWVGADPTESGQATLEWDGTSDSFTATWPPPYKGGRDIWIVPARPMAEVTHELRIRAQEGASAPVDLRVPPQQPAKPGGKRGALVEAKVGERALRLAFGYTPLPDPRGVALSGNDDEMREALKAMGYLADE